MTPVSRRVYGATVYFEKGKIAEVTSEFLEWTGDLCRIVDSHAALLAALEESDRVLKAFVDGQGQRGSILLAARQANLAAIRKARGE